MSCPWRAQVNSVLPPPMSNTRTNRASASNNGWQPVTAKLASSSAVMVSKYKPASRSTRLKNSLQFVARRQAAVATQRARVTLRRRIFPAQIFKASIVRSMACCDSCWLLSNPSPRRTMREKASTTRKLLAFGRATKSPQLFVPRSIAA